MFNQEDLSIFGATQEGVPSPLVGHTHPYPTRYHGPNWNQPQATYPYRGASYVKAPFTGLGVIPGKGCGCGGIKSVGKIAAGASPDGLGDSGGPPLFGTVTGHNLVDGALAAGLGYVMAPKKEDRAFWAALGGVAGAMAGTFGFVALVGAALWIRKGK